MMRTTPGPQIVLDTAVAELRDLPYSFWRDVVTDRSLFSRPLTEGSGRLEVDAGWHRGTVEIRVTVTLRRTWRRRNTDGFTITPTNEFR
jgi:hypothetical protein